VVVDTRVEFTYRSRWSLRSIDLAELSALAAVYELLSVILVGDRYFDIDLIFPEGRIQKP
jgi:hypothetical protein